MELAGIMLFLQTPFPPMMPFGLIFCFEATLSSHSNEKVPDHQIRQITNIYLQQLGWYGITGILIMNVRKWLLDDCMNELDRMSNNHVSPRNTKRSISKTQFFDCFSFSSRSIIFDPNGFTLWKWLNLKMKPIFMSKPFETKTAYSSQNSLILRWSHFLQ